MKDRALTSRGVAAGFALAMVLLASPAATLRAAGVDCTSCHDQGAKLAKSAHSALTCDTCHENYVADKHPAGITKPACATCHADVAGDYGNGVHGLARKQGNESAPDCGVCHGSAHELLPTGSQAFRGAVPDTCGMCHAEVAEQYSASVHGKAVARGVTQAPICTSCHGEHKIIRPSNSSSPVNAAHIRETCGSCHGDVRLTKKFGLPTDRIVSFDSSFHGLASKAGSQSVANCASCHGVHNILPSSDPKSTINAKNLPATCGKCHSGAGTRFAISQVHVADGAAGEPAIIRLVRQFYLLVIPVTIGLMLLHHAGDWMRKLIALRFRPRRQPQQSHASGELSMLFWERIQHAVLAIAFLTLGWTGFALKYPDQWWARPLLLLESKYPIRGIIHRTAAGVFVAAAIMHVVSLIASRKLREHWMLMLPKMNDPREALTNFAYNLGLGDRRPPRSHHSYVEKAEYWALVWGTIVMAGTGGLLWANNLALKFLPKIWLDVATSVHMYEATLAVLAIIVWHLYSTIFDPDVYPLNTSFLTGKSVKNDEHSDHPPQGSKAAGD